MLMIRKGKCRSTFRYNYIINTSLSDKSDCQYKLSTFIGSVNKLNASFRNLQHDVIARLLKSHCCSLYGSKYGIFILKTIKHLYYHGTSVRNILKLPYATHTWILGPLLGQPHIHCQLPLKTSVSSQKVVTEHFKILELHYTDL